MGESKLDEILKKLGKLDSLEEKLDANFEKINKNIENLEVRMRRVEQKMDKDRKLNLLFFNLKSMKITDKREEIFNILKYLNEDVRKYDIVDMFSIKGSPITVVKLTSVLLRNDILRNKKALKNSESFREIVIKEDFTPEVRKVRSGLQPFLEDKREKGHRATILYDKLLVDGRLMTLEYLLNEKEDKGLKRQRSDEDKTIQDTRQTKRSGSFSKVKLRPSSLERYFSRKEVASMDRQCGNQPSSPQENRREQLKANGTAKQEIKKGRKNSEGSPKSGHNKNELKT